MSLIPMLIFLISHKTCFFFLRINWHIHNADDQTRAHTHERERMLPQSSIRTYIHSRFMQPQNDSFLCSHSLSMCLYRHNSWQQHQFYFEKSVTRVQNTNDRPNDFSTEQQKRIFTPRAGPHCPRNESTAVAAATTTKTRRKNYMYFS